MIYLYSIIIDHLLKHTTYFVDILVTVKDVHAEEAMSMAFHKAKDESKKNNPLDVTRSMVGHLPVAKPDRKSNRRQKDVHITQSEAPPNYISSTYSFFI